MKISLIIPAYNEGKYIGQCLDSVLKNEPGKFSEIIVVNNASTDDTRAVAEARPGVRVLDELKKGVVRARQCGLDAASGDLLAYIDADTKMPAGWVEKALAIFAENPDVVCISGPYKYYDSTTLTSKLMAAAWWISAPIMYRMVGYMVLGGNFIARKDALLRMGGFDTSIEFYGDDTDIARKLHKYGKVLFRMDFFIYSSSRRIESEGFFKTNALYALNFLSGVFVGKPATKKYTDIRK